ncbi:hypothetical protein ARMGADRAFT_1029412 [Armillaria gallica]|uniref:Uncharacterized protein n=1 Tax=Armillaria gallica TaxID=47427 RepID=A0A2H3DGB8_ARMGA|nr:hypothetical protein ARMGADRAFT_1029412 [Armillaria gallica]
MDEHVVFDFFACRGRQNVLFRTKDHYLQSFNQSASISVHLRETYPSTRAIKAATSLEAITKKRTNSIDQGASVREHVGPVFREGPSGMATYENLIRVWKARTAYINKQKMRLTLSCRMKMSCHSTLLSGMKSYHLLPLLPLSQELSLPASDYSDDFFNFRIEGHIIINGTLRTIQGNSSNSVQKVLNMLRHGQQCSSRYTDQVANAYEVLPPKVAQTHWHPPKDDIHPLPTPLRHIKAVVILVADSLLKNVRPVQTFPLVGSDHSCLRLLKEGQAVTVGILS